MHDFLYVLKRGERKKGLVSIFWEMRGKKEGNEPRGGGSFDEVPDGGKDVLNFFQKGEREEAKANISSPTCPGENDPIPPPPDENGEKEEKKS